MFNILSQKLKFSPPFQSIELLDGAYPDAFSAIFGSWVLSRLLSGVGQRRTFDSHISQLKEPFYLTGDKSARLALIEPHIKKKAPQFVCGAIQECRAFSFPTRFHVAVISFLYYSVGKSNTEFSTLQ